MSDRHGLLVMKLDEAKSFGFLTFTLTAGSSQGSRMQRVTARLTNDADKKKYKTWSCDLVMSCHNGPVIERYPQHQIVLTNNKPFDEFSAPVRFDGKQSSARFLLSVVLYDQPELASNVQLKLAHGSVPKLEDKTIRFTDDEAKKLNTNCKIRFEDSDEPVFVNRELLAIYSNVFRAMFEGDFKEKNAEEIKLEAKRDNFLSFVDCLYLPPVPVTTQNFKAVVVMADRYDCPHLLEKCKDFMEERIKTAASIEEYKDFIEISEHLRWNKVMKNVIDSMKIKGVKVFTELLDHEWMMALKETSRHAVLLGMKSIIPPSMEIFPVARVPKTNVRNDKVRFTNEVEAKKLNANCVVRFADSNVPVYVNRELLGVYSNTFRAMFEGKDKDAKEIKLELKREDFLSFLDCLYFPPMPVEAHNLKAVATIAYRFTCSRLLTQCKPVADVGIRTMASLEDCKELIEVAERLDWSKMLTNLINSLKSKRHSCFIDLLDGHWIEERKKNTQQALFVGLKEMTLQTNVD